MGGKFHLKLNIYGSLIAHKYRKGKVKRTLKRESKVLETAYSQWIETIESSCHTKLLLVDLTLIRWSFGLVQAFVETDVSGIWHGTSEGICCAVLSLCGGTIDCLWYEIG